MAWNPKLKLTPRLVAMLEYEERRATERGDGYLGTEHMLEAILSDPQGVAAGTSVTPHLSRRASLSSM
jgi:hypothetical protein